LCVLIVLIVILVLALIIYYAYKSRINGIVELVEAFRGKVSDVGHFYLLNWNYFLNLHRLDIYLRNHPMSEDEVGANADFLAIVNRAFTPNSYGVLINQDGVILAHPDSSVVGKFVQEVDTAGTLTHIALKAISDDAPTRGFYVGADGEEKYGIFSPLSVSTSDQKRLYYLYVVNTKDMPSRYRESLKENSTAEDE